MSNLLIVESPAKGKTLKAILGPNWSVQASFGHITELANDGEESLGFTLYPDHVECHYQPRGEMGKRTIAQLRQAVKHADCVYIASDPDREGEAIAYHLVQQLRLQPGQYRRVTYTQITESAVKDAIRNARDLDMALVGAQQVRQCLDKLAGFKVSPLLWNSSGGRSAGRVQSPALHLVCQRERDIQHFQPTDYWSVWSEYQEGFRAYYWGEEADPEPEVEASSDDADENIRKQPESKRVFSAGEADRLVQIAKTHPHQLLSFTGKQVSKAPPPPFTTSTLQQAAGVRCGFNPEQTMAISQVLFEGVTLSQGHKALITYHRTDSIALAPEFCAATQAWLSTHDPDNVPRQATKHREKAGAQGAHEAIRPTYLELTPAQVQSHLSKDQFSLYDLIWRRAISSQCAPAILQKTRALIQSGSVLWEARGSVLLSSGYTKYWNDLAEDSQIPVLSNGHPLTLKNVASTKKQTQPPPRYSEPRLVQALERLSIGRPSTYANILKTLKERHYVTLQGKVLIPTELGRKTDEVVAQSVPSLVQAGFTAEMEFALDEIAAGRLDWQQYLIEWHQNRFQPEIDRAYARLGIQPHTVHPPSDLTPSELTEYPCPVCGQRMEKHNYQKNGQAKQMLRCSVASHRQQQCKSVAYFWSTQKVWWSPEYGTLGDHQTQTEPMAAVSKRTKSPVKPTRLTAKNRPIKKS